MSGHDWIFLKVKFLIVFFVFINSYFLIDSSYVFTTFLTINRNQQNFHHELTKTDIYSNILNTLTSPPPSPIFFVLNQSELNWKDEFLLFLFLSSTNLSALPSTSSSYYNFFFFSNTEDAQPNKETIKFLILTFLI